MNPTTRPPRQDVVRNRARLLASAEALIREHGMDLSLNAVAHHAGVGVGTVYRHFTDRDALLRAMFEERIEKVEAIMTSHLSDPDPVQGLRDAVLEVCEMQAHDRGVWEVLSAGPDKRQRDIVRDRLVPIGNRLVKRATDTGAMRAGFDPSDLPVLLWTGGALSTYLGVVSATAWRRYINALLDGLLATSDGPQRAALAETPDARTD